MTTTAIESKIKREGGTEIPFGNVAYKFLPYTDGAHVCEVGNPEHADRLLAITEGYCLYRGTGTLVGPLSAPAPALAARRAEPAAAPAPVPAPEPAATAAPEILLGGDYPATITIHGIDYQLGTIVAQAQAKSGVSSTMWNEVPQDVRDGFIEAELNALEDAGPATAPEQSAAAPALSADRDSLVAQYTEVFGKKPHYNLGVTKLQEMIAAQLEAKHS